MTDTKDTAALRDRLAGLQGRSYWRSLEELAGTDEFCQWVERELPQAASLLSAPVNRRDFLRLMGASLALAGLGACARKPAEEIVPYVETPEELVLGKPLHFASAFTLSGFATGVVVESHEGRPVKIEGNPQHPLSVGATLPFAQAAILDLYDPQRSQVVLQSGRISTWEAFMGPAGARMAVQREKRGAGLRILTGAVTSPTLGAQMRALLEALPDARWIQYEPVSRGNSRAAARLAFGQELDSFLHLDRAAVIVSLDADVLFSEPASLRYARDFSAARRVRGGRERMNRLYVAEPAPSITGSMADHRLAVRAGDIAALAQALAARLGVKGSAGAGAQASASHAAWLDAAAGDLSAHRGTSVVVAGESQPPDVHLLAHALNQALGNSGKTSVLIEPAQERLEGRMETLQELVSEMQEGAVESLFIFDANPVFTAPVDLRFAEALSKVPFRVHLGLNDNETAALCHWHLPKCHFLESWGDAKSYDGTVTILQPLIAPLYAGRTEHEMVALLSGSGATSSYDLVREFWRSRIQVKDFETWWRRVLHDGIVDGTGAVPKPVTVRPQSLTTAEPVKAANTVNAPDQALELVFRPDPTIWDGRFANNAWLQELPKPLTKLTWDNAALISPRTAQRLELQSGDIIELQAGNNRVAAPVWINPGQADESVAVNFGYGRTRVGDVGRGTGFNAYVLRTTEHPWFASGLQIAKTGRRMELASTQGHHSMEGRALVRYGTLEEYLKDPDFVHEMGHEPPPELTLYPEFKFDGPAWGMVIDTNVCIGCNACVVACQAENNIPVVGKTEVLRGREMHWIRLDRYYEGPAEDPQVLFQPVPCMHCEKAPCELVCPVAATVHSAEGLNDMVYNRCVGTRYCSNNCPYKVRRFNFFQYSDFDSPTLKLGRNPDVTVRSRGVMEKCTYCVQRINRGRIEAKKDNRPIRDGEVVPACAQACPTEAIVFGDIHDPKSAVARLKQEPLNYSLLGELNTRPRTTYLGRLKNPNSKIGEPRK